MTHWPTASVPSEIVGFEKRRAARCPWSGQGIRSESPDGSVSSCRDRNCPCPGASPSLSWGGRREIIRQPRGYVFDTGLIACVRGWEQIRETDRGRLWENLVLDELLATSPIRTLHYWRDKSQREIDFCDRATRREGGCHRGQDQSRRF
ncbi:MAG: DUF4143 domain-containing protein [Planctomycetes bacterium]|nr:DUF4143 domain-containing protein [Planctomycetota bacterium]